MTAKRKYPPLPKVLHAPGGPVTIRYVAKLDAMPSGETTMGEYDPLTREISIKRDLRPPILFATLYHEFVHVWLADSGLTNGLGDGQLEEALCDAIATGMMRWQHG